MDLYDRVKRTFLAIVEHAETGGKKFCTNHDFFSLKLNEFKLKVVNVAHDIDLRVLQEKIGNFHVILLQKTRLKKPLCEKEGPSLMTNYQ